VLRTDVVVIGGGPAGLAMSARLSERSVDHVILERGEVANSWRTERWDSLRLLTPNWMTRLPGGGYDGDDPDGYMTAGEVVGLLDRYACGLGAPIVRGAEVDAVASGARGHAVRSTVGEWAARAVVVATGASSRPMLPSFAPPPSLHQVASIDYRNPGELPDGPVLVVGASASGVQIADELCRAGREVTLAVGSHTRLPRVYRGRNIHTWMQALGLLDTRYDSVDDIAKARRRPSLQLVGTPEQRTLDLNALRVQGVQLVGKLVGFSDRRAQFGGSLAATCRDADLKLGRLLDQIDPVADACDAPRQTRPEPTHVPDPVNAVDLSRCSTVIWATGHRPSYPWLDPRLLDRRGAIVHDGGVMSLPGLYAMGLPFMIRRTSSFFAGFGADADELASRIVEHLDRSARAQVQSSRSSRAACTAACRPVTPSLR
jgi:putative flavoprotein involved in K+ transport